MFDKLTKKKQNKQGQLPIAGLLPGDYATELFGVKETRKVFGICNGCTIPFLHIHPDLKAELFTMLLEDDKAMQDLKDMTAEAALEEYAFCLYGDADGTPDFDANGKPGTSENFTCGKNCRCLNWKNKRVNINGNPLTRREVEVTQKLASDMVDKQIAAELNISTHTLTQHKRNLFEKANVSTRTGLVQKSYNERLILQ